MGCGLRIVSPYFDFTPPVLVEKQREVFERFDLPLEQCRTRASEGSFLDEVVRSDFSLLLYFSPYCVPLFGDFIRVVCCLDPFERLVGLRSPGFGEWVVGGFFALSRDVYERAGRPSFLPYGGGVLGQRLIRGCRVNRIDVRFLVDDQLVYRGVVNGFRRRCDRILSEVPVLSYG